MPRSWNRLYVNHLGLGASDKPHDPAAYAMEVRVGDVAGVLDELSLERADFIGMSWGGRLGFGIGEHAPDACCPSLSAASSHTRGPTARSPERSATGSQRLEPRAPRAWSSAGGLLEHPLSR